MKRLIAIILILVSVWSLAACVAHDTTKETDSIKNNESNTTEVGDSTENETEGTGVETEPSETKPTLNCPEYKMAQIGTDSRVSESKYGFHKTRLDSENAEGQTFYALSWVFEETEFTEDNYNWYTFKLKEATTGEVIEDDDEHILLHTYRSTVYDTEEFEGDGIKFYGHPGKQIYALVLYSDYEVKFDDIEVWVEYNSADYKLDFNSELSEMTIAPKRATGNMFIKMKDNYYVADASSSGGGSGEDINWDTYDFISVSNPLTSINSDELIMDATKITFYDTETGEHLNCVPGTELYYDEKVESDRVDVRIGIITSDEELLSSWYKRYRVFYDGATLLG